MNKILLKENDVCPYCKLFKMKPMLSDKDYIQCENCETIAKRVIDTDMFEVVQNKYLLTE
jgi:hypothetical protein